MSISIAVRPSFVVLAAVLACAPPAPVTDGEPARAEASPRPSLKGNRLVAAGPEIALEVTVSGPVAAGGTATASARVAAGARCRIRVGYRSGPSEAQGLEPLLVGESGLAEWTWVVGFTTTPGEWPIEVDCALPDGSTARGHASLPVAPRD